MTRKVSLSSDRPSVVVNYPLAKKQTNKLLQHNAFFINKATYILHKAFS